MQHELESLAGKELESSLIYKKRGKNMLEEVLVENRLSTVGIKMLKQAGRVQSSQYLCVLSVKRCITSRSFLCLKSSLTTLATDYLLMYV